GVLWVSEGLAPVCDSAFRKISLWDLKASDELLPKPPNGLTETMQRAYARYRDASAAWLDRSDARAAFAAAGDACALEPEEPIYRYMHGLFALRCGAYEAAEEQLAAGAELPDFPHR